MAGEGMSKGEENGSGAEAREQQAARDTVGDLLALLDAGAEDAAWLAVHTVARVLAGGPVQRG